jgi:hypothetical protein
MFNNQYDENWDFTIFLSIMKEVFAEWTEATAAIKIKPVIYQETELFTNNFTYPFQKQRKVVSAGEGSRVRMYLRPSLVCFDNDLWSDFYFWKKDRCDIANTTNFHY